MKRNFSLPKMNTIEIANRLNRLKARDKPRLQFPAYIQSRKHYIQKNLDNVKFGQEKVITPIKQVRRDHFDISDIQGTRPRLIQKQNNVIKYYKNTNQQYNPFRPQNLQPNISRSLSDKRLQSKHSVPTLPDSLDIFQKQVQQKLSLNPQSKRQYTQPMYQNSNQKYKKHTNTINTHQYPQKMKYIIEQNNGVQRSKRNFVFNPTFMSQLVFL